MSFLKRAALAAFAVLFSGLPVFASGTGYKDYANNYIIGFLALCGIIVVAQVLTALREPSQRIKSTQQIVDEAEAAHHSPQK